MSHSVILEFLGEYDLELPPKALYRNLNRHGHDIGYSTVRLRVREMEERGLVEKDKDGYYEVAELGWRWLDGEVSIEELEDE